MQNDSTRTCDPIPYGYCQCGCGKKAPKAIKTIRKLGHVKGQPIRFIHGHTGRINAQQRAIPNDRRPYWSEANNCYAVKLTQGRVAKFDACDLGVVAGRIWSLIGGAYARSKIAGEPAVKMHRLILNIPEGVEIDHINGDGCDNRRANLRICSQAENQRNRGANTNNTSGFKGVSPSGDRGKWVARIMVDGQHFTLGRFYSARDAALVYDMAAMELHGQFAQANFHVVGFG